LSVGLGVSGSTQGKGERRKRRHKNKFGESGRKKGGRWGTSGGRRGGLSIRKRGYLRPSLSRGVPGTKRTLRGGGAGGRCKGRQKGGQDEQWLSDQDGGGDQRQQTGRKEREKVASGKSLIIPQSQSLKAFRTTVSVGEKREGGGGETGSPSWGKMRSKNQTEDVRAEDGMKKLRNEAKEVGGGESEQSKKGKAASVFGVWGKGERLPPKRGRNGGCKDDGQDATISQEGILSKKGRTKCRNDTKKGGALGSF